MIRIFHKGVINGNSIRDLRGGIDTLINECFHSDIRDTMIAETIYYISGWLVCACSVEGRRRGGNTNSAKALLLVYEICSVPESKKNELVDCPIRKVERAMKFGGLRFVTFDFFRLVSLIEFVFEKYLSKKSMVIHGESIVRSIINIVLLNKHVVDLFCEMMPGEREERPISLDVLKFVLLVYGRFRGKEFVRKMMGSDKQSLEIGTRPTLSVLSNSVKREKIDEIDKDVHTHCADLVESFTE